MRIKVVALEKFDNFLTMLQKIGYKKAIPNASSVDEAYEKYLRFYSEASQKDSGVLVISVELHSET